MNNVDIFDLNFSHSVDVNVPNSIGGETGINN